MLELNSNIIQISDNIFNFRRCIKIQDKQPNICSVIEIWAFEKRYDTSDQYSPDSPKIGFFLIQFPDVKSGNSTGSLPIAIECSDKGVMTIQEAVS